MNHSGNNPHAPQSGQTLVQGGQPQYGAPQPYGPPGVAVALPGSQPQQQQQYGQPGYGQYPQAQPQYPQAQPQYPQAQYPQHAPQQQAVPAKPPAKPPGRQDELLANAGRTVYEFRGEHSEEARSGGRHQTFFADDTNLASVAVTDDRQHSNLKSSGATSWIIGGIVIAVVGALTAFFVVAAPSNSAANDADSKEDVAPPAAPEAPAAVDPAATPPVDPAAAGGTPAPADGAVTPPADGGGTTPPADPPKPADDEAKPAEEAKPPEEPKEEPKKDTTTKKKSSTKKKTEEKKKTPSITPSKPPRSGGLDNLPAPD